MRSNYSDLGRRFSFYRVRGTHGAEHVVGHEQHTAGENGTAKGGVISLGGDIEGILKASEISRDRVEDARNVLKEGDEVEAKIISIDRKSRVISLSVKSKDVEDEKDAMKELRNKQEAETTGPTTIGDLIRAQMNQN